MKDFSKIPEDKKLTEKQELFCEEYLVDFNAARAYRVAYNCKNDKVARTEGFYNLCRPNIKKYLLQAKEERKQAILIDQERVVTELCQIACDERAKQGDRLKALEAIGKHLGMFNDKLSITADVKENNALSGLSKEEIVDLIKSLSKS